MNELNQPLALSRGKPMKNRFMLAPLTNLQSHEDGTLSDEEFHWLTMRSRGGFGLTMTCAAHVQAVGQGFPGQLGIFDDRHVPGLTRLATEIKAADSLAIVQLHHAGMRSPRELIGTTPVCPSVNEETGSRALSGSEVSELVTDFVSAAKRAEAAGFDGIEIHGAHGYIICQFLSSDINHREDEYGGSLANRSRLIDEIIDGIRATCRSDFQVGVRLSAERFGIKLEEARALAARLLVDDRIDFLDMSLWNVFKEPEEEDFKGRRLIDWFTDLPRKGVRLGAAGSIRTPRDAEAALAAGLDWIMLGRAAILHHDFPDRYRDDPTFEPVQLPVTRDYLRGEGLSEKFVGYMNGWAGFVSDEQQPN